MFAKSSLSSTAAVFMPGATGATVTESYMQQQYYTNNCEQMNSYGMGYGYNYDTYSQDAYGHGQQWVTNNWTKKPDVLNLDDFSDLSDSDDEAVANVAAVAKKVDTKVAPPEALVMECGSAEPAEEPSPCAISGKDAKDLEAESDAHETFGERTVSTSDISSASSEPEGEASEILENVYDLRFLLKCRTTSTEPPEVVYRAMAVEEPKKLKGGDDSGVEAYQSTQRIEGDPKEDAQIIIVEVGSFRKFLGSTTKALEECRLQRASEPQHQIHLE